MRGTENRIWSDCRDPCTLVEKPVDISRYDNCTLTPWMRPLYGFSNGILLSRTLRFPTVERRHTFRKQAFAACLQFTFSKTTLCNDDTIIKFNHSTKQKGLCGKQLTGTTEIKIYETSLLRILCFQKVLECHNRSSNWYQRILQQFYSSHSFWEEHTVLYKANKSLRQIRPQIVHIWAENLSNSTNLWNALHAYHSLRIASIDLNCEKSRLVSRPVYVWLKSDFFLTLVAPSEA
jgi:hypothetical protein